MTDTVLVNRVGIANVPGDRAIRLTTASENCPGHTLYCIQGGKGAVTVLRFSNGQIAPDLYAHVPYRVQGKQEDCHYCEFLGEMTCDLDTIVSRYGYTSDTQLQPWHQVFLLTSDPVHTLSEDNLWRMLEHAYAYYFLGVKQTA